MSADKTVIQGPILVLQALQERILPQRCIAGLELIVRAPALLVQRIHAIWQTTCKSERPTLCGREAGALIETRVSEDSIATEGNLQYPFRRCRRGHG